jgi:hypothetical protein
MVLVAMLAVCPEIVPSDNNSKTYIYIFILLVIILFDDLFLQCGMQPPDLSATKTPHILQDRQIIEVETELFIGPPDSRDTACPQNHKS